MRPFHVLAAALSLGGTIAAVSASHAAAFDPVRMTGPMGKPGAAVAVPCDVLLATSPRPCTRTLVQALRGNGRNPVAELSSDAALDRHPGRVVDDPLDTARPRQFQIQVSQDIYRIYAAPARPADDAAAPAVDAMLDLSTDGD